jgi:hypothetical protein
MTVHRVRKGVARVARPPVPFERICIIGVWERSEIRSALSYTHSLSSVLAGACWRGYDRSYTTRIAEHLLHTDQCRKSFTAKISSLLTTLRSNRQSRHPVPLCSLNSPIRVLDTTLRPVSYHISTNLASHHRLTIQAHRRTSRRHTYSPAASPLLSDPCTDPSPSLHTLPTPSPPLVLWSSCSYHRAADGFRKRQSLTLCHCPSSMLFLGTLRIELTPLAGAGALEKRCEDGVGRGCLWRSSMVLEGRLEQSDTALESGG